MSFLKGVFSLDSLSGGPSVEALLSPQGLLCTVNMMLTSGLFWQNNAQQSLARACNHQLYC